MTNPRPWHLAWLGVCLAACFLVYSLLAYIRAGQSPPDPAPNGDSAPLRLEPRRTTEPGRYAHLAEGRIFFGAAETAAGEAQPGVYVSRLVLRGIIWADGRAPLAVLTRAGAPPDSESWTVRVGETVLDEEVVAIERNSVILRQGGLETVLVLND